MRLPEHIFPCDERFSRLLRMLELEWPAPEDEIQRGELFWSCEFDEILFDILHWLLVLNRGMVHGLRIHDETIFI